MRRAAVAVLGTAAALALCATPAAGFVHSVQWASHWEYNEHETWNGGGAFLRAASRDVSRVIFVSPQHLTHSDQDQGGDDIYASAGGKLRQLSLGPVHEKLYGADDAEFDAASPDARAVAWATDEDLTPDDRDLDRDYWHVGRDVYVRRGTRTTLISTGPNVGRGEYNHVHDNEANASFAGGSQDLDRVFFVTKEQVLAADGEDDYDVYLRAGGHTTLVSAGKGVDAGVDFLSGADDRPAVSASGHTAFLLSDDPMTAGDRDGETDVFQWRDGRVRQVTRGPAGGNGDLEAGDDISTGLIDISSDGDRAWFYTAERLTKDDRDQRTDLYEWNDGRTRLVSTGPAAANGPYDYGLPADVDPMRGWGMFRGASPDGRRVYFTTAERLTGDDHDATQDLYVRSGGHTTLLSPAGHGPRGNHGVTWARPSADGSTVFLSGDERLTSDDRDHSIDIYAIAGGRLRRLSTGPLGGNDDEPMTHGLAYDYRPTDAGVSFISRDGKRLFFYTQERLAAHARPDAFNFYETRDGKTSTVRLRAAGGKVVNLDTHPVAATPDGSRFVFHSDDRLVPGDRNDYTDLYWASLIRR